MTDLVGCETGIPPQNTVYIQLDKAENEFFLYTPDEDNEKYKFELSNVCLYVPVAQLSQSVYSEINSILVNPKEQRDITIHYRKLEVKTVSLPTDKQEFYTQSLFHDADLPCKIVVCFVEGKAKVGDYHKNPFDFRRKFTYVEENRKKNSEDKVFDERRLDSLENKFENLATKFDILIDALTTQKKDVNDATKKTKGKGRGKKTQQNDTESGEPDTLPSTSRFVSYSNKSADSNSDIFTDDVSVQSDVVTTKTVYLKKLQCFLNNVPVDAIEDFQTEDECMQAYWRLFAFNGQLNSLFTNSISYDDFR
jgi:hypothetical protein